MFRRNNLIATLYQLAIKYPTPINIQYLWSFGVFGLVSLMIQIITGILLVMHYTPHIDYAFVSVEHIMRDVNLGWFLRYSHANGASIFFIAIYIHIIRGLFYGSYLAGRELLWCTGVVIFLLMITTAFLGYILPWGQMSLWGATVITNLASVIPVIGDIIVFWLWGGFSVANPTLNRFFSLHYLLPFVILAFVGIHLILLHTSGSNNPLGVEYRLDNIPFGLYFLVKDLFILFPFFICFISLVLFFPNFLGHPDNYIKANSDVTPAHIVPEWYFLPFYAILRSIPDKALGVVALLASIVMLLILPFVHKTYIRVSAFKPIYSICLSIFLSMCIILGIIGGKPIEQPYLFIGSTATALYFIFVIGLIFADSFDNSVSRFLIYNQKAGVKL